MKHDHSHWWNSDETVTKHHETWPFTLVKQWWNSDETCWIGMKQDESEGWKTVTKQCWIRMNQQWNNLFRGHETPWNMLNQDESGSWNTLNRDHETTRIRMKQCVSWSWNILFHGNDTPWIRSNDQIDIVTTMLITNLIKLISYIDFWFMMFHDVSRYFTALFHGVSKCFKVFPCFVSSHFMTMKQVQWERACILFVHCCFPISLSTLLTWQPSWT